MPEQNYSKWAWLWAYMFSNALLTSVCFATQYLVVSLIPHDTIIHSPVFDFTLVLFSAIALVSHCTLLCVVPALCLLFLFRLGWPLKRVAVVGVLLFSAYWILMIANYLVFKIYRYHISGFFLNIIFHSDANQIFALSTREKQMIACTLLFVSLFQVTLAYSLQRFRVRLGFEQAKTISLVLVGALMFSYGLVVMAIDTSAANRIEQFVAHGFIRASQPIPYFNELIFQLLPKNAAHAYMMQGADLFSQMEREQHTLQYPLHPLSFQVLHKKLNVLIIGIDTWRYDMQNPKVTPRIAAFAPKTWQFMQHLSGGNSTEPGIFSLFYGLPISYWSSMLQQQQGPLLLHTFLTQGYHLSVFTSATNAIPPYDQSLFREVPNLIRDTPADQPYERDALINKEFEHDYLQHPQQPFFSFVFYNTAHSYCTPNPYPKPFQPALAECERYHLDNHTDLTALKNRYQNAVHYVDSLVGDLLDFLEQQKLLDHTIVIITGDHGEEFNDYGNDRYGHAGNFTDAQIKTPLLMYVPGARPQMIRQETTHYQVVPWLMQHVLGCRNRSSDYAIEPALLTPGFQRKWLLVGSYIGFGIRTHDHIINIFSNGNFDTTDLQGNLLSDRIDPQLFKDAFATTQTYYQQRARS
jgi:hypothetical protein